MRSVIRGLLLVVASGCGGPSERDPAPVSPAEQESTLAEAFDPNSGEQTAEWLVREFRASRTFPKGKPEEAFRLDQRYRAALDAVSDNRIRWPVTVDRVLPDGRIGVKRIDLKRTFAGKPRTFALNIHVSPTSAPLTAAELAEAPNGFPSTEVTRLWALRQGDPLVLMGTVGDLKPVSELSSEDPDDAASHYHWHIEIDRHRLLRPRSPFE
ncbi:unnamed protein product [Gemmata massiliana]|uniref:Uncharacterized protein n=1 Tax=Gemmata massiliana TaxID=1210884 RepID=A0A6P2CRN7_9BACT|nr:hypothetical protein [Gemmata massiliana]VTR91593.1 unnamed protein product [Gemmata massiliana]